MPIARICLDCNRLYSPSNEPTQDHARCPQCRPTHQQRKTRGKHKNTPQRHLQNTFYRSSSWQKTRKIVLARDGSCTYCGTRNHLTVHHVASIREAPERALDPDNLTTLCRTCHGRLENQQKRRR